MCVDKYMCIVCVHLCVHLCVCVFVCVCVGGRVNVTLSGWSLSYVGNRERRISTTSKYGKLKPSENTSEPLHTTASIQHIHHGAI